MKTQNHHPAPAKMLKDRSVMPGARPIVCAYYFPNWHVDPRSEAIHGKGWTEWRVVRYATPRFPGHDQPKIPLWGYGDEADPSIMAQKIATASEYGIDAFVFDWYYDSNGSFRERCIRDGFLMAPNCRKLEFALMWANHDHPCSHPRSYWNPDTPVWRGDVDPEIFRRCTDHCIAHYFNQPNYLRVDGKLYFSIYRIKEMVEQLGGHAAAAEIFSDFRHQVEKAGLGEVMLDCMARNISENGVDFSNDLIRKFGIDCCSDYNWWGFVPDDMPALSYEKWFERHQTGARTFSRNLAVPYNPLAMSGWDSSPRTVQSDIYDKFDYPFTPIVTGNTPQIFRHVLKDIKDGFDSGEITGSLLHLACWNEWTEGAYLEPDTVNGYGMLEAVRGVFGVKPHDV